MLNYIAEIVNYLEMYGPPPIVLGCTVKLKSENFDHVTKKYSCSTDGPGEIRWLISTKMYSTIVSVLNDDKEGRTQFFSEAHSNDQNNQIIVVKDITSSITVEISM